MTIVKNFDYFFFKYLTISVTEIPAITPKMATKMYPPVLADRMNEPYALCIPETSEQDILPMTANRAINDSVTEIAKMFVILLSRFCLITFARLFISLRASFVVYFI